MTKIIGLTGGIGSGKTMVANYINSLGIPVYIADEHAKTLLNSEQVLPLLIKEFGDILNDNNQINRTILAKLVFGNPDKLQKLNDIVHPEVKKHFDNWLLEHKDYPYIVKEAAILFETGSYKSCDIIITVVAPIEVRIKRVIERDNTDYESILKRMDNQWSDEKKVENSHYAINNISIDDTKMQVDQILKSIYYDI